MLRWKYDFVTGCLMLVFCAVSSWYVSIAMKADPLSRTYFLAEPDTYAYLWMIVLAFLSILLILRSFRDRKRSGGTEAMEPVWNKLRLITLVLTLFYVILLPVTGFILTTIAVVFTLCFMNVRNMIDKRSGKALVRQVVTCALVAVGVTMICYYTFRVFLKIMLPEGVLFY